MINRPIFIGPVYPPKDIMAAIIGLSVSLDCTANQLTPKIQSPLTAAYITDLVSVSGVISFRMVCRYAGSDTDTVIDSSDPRVTYNTIHGYTPQDFGGSDKYNISPCCLILTAVGVNESDSLYSISCKYPITTTLYDNELNISVDDAVGIGIDGDKPRDDVAPGISAINGLLPGTGDISITGLGDVVVTVHTDNESSISSLSS